MIKRYAFIQEGKVENVILWETENGDVHDNTTMQVVETTDAAIGDLYVDGQFVKPDPIPSEEENI